jgi:hypothetical protein
MAAVATVTRNLGHAFLAGLLLGAGILLSVVMLSDFMTPSGWGDLEWIFLTGAAAVAFCAALAVVLLQYRWRRTMLSAAIFAAGAVIVVAISFAPPWQPAFTVQSWFSKRAIPSAAVRISFDPHTVMQRTETSINFPILVENVPPHLDAQADWVLIESPWHAGWSTVSSDMDMGTVKIPVSEADFNRFKDVPIHLRGSIDLALVDERNRDKLRYKIIDSNAPYPTSPWFGPIRRVYWDWEKGFPIAPVAYIQRSFDLGPLRLADAAAH